MAAVVSSSGFCFSQSSVWEVSKNGNTLYLGGSVHLLRAEDFPLPKEFDTAFDNSDVLVLEADVEQISSPDVAQRMMAQAMLSGDTTVQTLLNAETYNLLAAKCEEFSIPLTNVVKLKPAILAMLLEVTALQQLGFTPQGVDVFYLAKAKAQGKELDFLETVDFQINLLVNIGNGCENEFVQYSLEELVNIEEEINAMIPELKSGTSEAVESGNQDMKEKFPSVYKSLISNRNNDWIPRIETYLADKKMEFVVVGLGHLHGPDGVLAQLVKKGCTVNQVK
ncbi:GumN family protein [Candidatus Symbiothrix dinenymphae]|nr:GumN family protein [Candidatus Symbiothrix dinenymphae]